jgi:CRISPR-associated endonuclease/helicase Cas3
VALHDVGKFSSWFQGKNQQAWDESVKPVLGAWKPPPASRHDADGYDLRDALNLRKLLHPATQTWRPKDLIELWVAVTGHHGQPANQYRSILSDGLTRPCRDAAAAFVADVRALFEPLDPLPRPSAYNLRILSWLLCGLTVVSDWIGSNRDWFPYRHPDQTLPEYWIYARGRAAPAIDQTGLRPRRRPPELTPERLLPARIADNLSPLQKHVSQMLLPDGPLMAIVEDVTGSGKTEAALLLAARLMKSGRADGLYFALPTMATANAMYDRLARSYEKLFADGSKPSLVLAHGKRALNSAFTDSILPLRDIAESYEDEGAPHVLPGLPMIGARHSWRMSALVPSTRRCLASCRLGIRCCACGA